MQVVTLFDLTHVLSHSLNTLSETIFSDSLIFQEFAKLKYTLNLKISESQNLTNAKISRPKVCQNKHFSTAGTISPNSKRKTFSCSLGIILFNHKLSLSKEVFVFPYLGFFPVVLYSSSFLAGDLQCFSLKINT